MAKKNKETSQNVDDQIKNLGIGSVIGDLSHYSLSLPKTVSLNLKKESFFSLGGNKMRLNCNNHTCTVPEELSSDEIQKVRNAIDNGTLVEGEVFIPPIERDEEVLKEYCSLIKQFGFNNLDNKSPSVVKIRQLFKKGIDRNWTAKEIANYCINEEKKGKNRKDVVQTLENLHRFSDCPDTLFEVNTK